jgi:hypothetical protein
MLSSWHMYEMHLALFLKAGCDIFNLIQQPTLIAFSNQNHIFKDLMVKDMTSIIRS